VLHCRKLKTTIVSQGLTDRDTKIIELEKEISQLNHELMLERHKNSEPTIDEP